MNHFFENTCCGSTCSRLLLLLFLLAGCNADYVRPNTLVEVQGKVLLDRRPVVGARIVFVPEKVGRKDEYGLSYGVTDSQGAFTLKLADEREGAFPGMHRVFISKVDFTAARPAQAFGRNLPSIFEQAIVPPKKLRRPDQPGVVAEGEEIPIYYNSQSDLTQEIVPGRGIMRVKFELTSVDPLLVRNKDQESSNE